MVKHQNRITIQKPTKSGTHQTMKKIVFTILFLSLPYTGLAQTYLKANALYWAVGITNAAVETKLGNRFTFNADVVYSPWKSINGNHFEFVQIMPEGRLYTKEAFKGLYLGAYASFQAFNITKWNYWNKGRYQKGRGYAFGITLGYVLPISARWNIDFFLGGGWQNSHYKGYVTGTDKMYTGWNGSGEWLPYKAGVSIAYRL